MDVRGAYAILGLQPTATLAEAKRAFRTRAQLMHPDRVSAGLRQDAEGAMAQLNEAWSLVREHLERHGPGLPPEDTPPAWRGPSASSAAPPAVRPPFVGECDLCGWAPAAPIKLRRVTGAVIWHSRYIAEPELCRLCADGFFAESQAQTLMKGWWGVVAPLVNLYYIWENVQAIAGHRRRVPMGQSRDPRVVTPVTHPMPFVPLSRRGAPFAMTLLAVVVASFLVASFVSGSQSETSINRDREITTTRTDGRIGTCLTSSGRVVDCGDASAAYELTEKVGIPELCGAGVTAFQDPSDEQWYCASPV